MEELVDGRKTSEGIDVRELCILVPIWMRLEKESY
jgi:hypothetical protein